MPTDDEIAMWMNLFRELDQDGDGYISREELVCRLKTPNMDTHNLDKMVKAMDFDRDGRISLGEYKVALGITKQPVNSWRRLFRKLDRDSSGFLDINEIETLFTQEELSKSRDALYAWIEKYDTNKDGKISMREFMSFVAEQAQNE